MWAFKKIFFFVGLSFLAASAYLAFDIVKFLRQAEKIPGQVALGHDIVYQVREANYFYETILKNTVGSTVTILYNPKYPEAAKPDQWIEIWIVPLIFAVLGTLFVWQGWGPIRTPNWRLEGERITTDFVRFKNGHVVSRWHNPADGKIHTFVGHTRGTPQDIPEDKKIIVYVNPKNPRQYIMNL